MVLRKFKNIFGKKINVMTKPMQPDEVLVLDVPVKCKENSYRESSEMQEIKNLLKQKYIVEIIEGKISGGKENGDRRYARLGDY